MDNYHYLGNLIGAYFNQDHDLIADTIEGVIAYYIRNNSTEDINNLRRDIDEFIQRNTLRLDNAFEESYGCDFDPKLWGHTTESFLAKVNSLLEADAP